MRVCFFLTLCLGAVASWAGTPDLSTEMAEQDRLLFEAVNTCDIEGMRRYFTEDIEFYHDKAPTTTTLEQLVQLSVARCNSDDGFRRELVPGTLKTYPMHDGALQTGEHLFYGLQNGKEVLMGRAYFMHLWVKRDGQWQISRVMSYDHKPAT